jgi:carboxypeptidase family protein/TonB-dependent receptor-like protein
MPIIINWARTDRRTTLSERILFHGTLFVGLLVSLISLSAQSPEASILGVVSNREGQRLSGVRVTVVQSETNFSREAATDSQGQFYIASLPRGVYSLRVEAPGYGSLEKQGVELAVGARDEENFALTPAASADGGAGVSQLFQVIPPAPALPVETVASSVSVVVEETKILQLPLASRNLYSLFLLEPGVTSQGAIVRRGLSFSVHGQRVSGSNYQLDGMDNNNIIVTGPVTAVSAEAIQEFRMVNSSFSAENGRATAFVAQSVTRVGTNRFHGGLFEYLGNNGLDANTFQNNASSIAEPALRQNQFGYWLGGPLRRNRNFFWSGLESSRLRFATPQQLRLPTASFINGLPQDSIAGRLLREIPPIPVSPSPSNPSFGDILFAAPGQIDDLYITERIDNYFPNEKDRLTARYSLASTSSSGSSDFRGYPMLVATDHFRGHNSLVAWAHNFNAGQVNYLRAGWSRERIEQPRPRPDIPRLQSNDGTFLPANDRDSDQRENNNVFQISDNFSFRRGRSALAMGFEFRKELSNRVTLGLQSQAYGGPRQAPDGLQSFANLAAFGAGSPTSSSIAVDRFSSGDLRLPDLRRQYRSSEYAFFIQDDLKLFPRLSLNAGLRYEYYGVPHNTDRSKDLNLYFGPGGTFENRLAGAELRSTDQNPGDLAGLLYRRDRLNFAPSVGLAWDPFGRGRTVVRAGYAVALDRIFDTIRDLATNRMQNVNCTSQCSLVLPGERILSQVSQTLGPTSVIQLDENVRTPYAQNWYLGVQQSVTPSLLLEVGHAGSVGRKLISRDVINRIVGRVNNSITTDTFLSNAGNSNYLALELRLRHHLTRGFQSQFSYTWSHAIDNQSDVLEGPRVNLKSGLSAIATFTRQLDSRVDRGNANFDQRHNFVFNAIWEIPRPRFGSRWTNAIGEGWTISTIGAYRTGFPVTLLGYTMLPTANPFLNNRLDFIGGTDQKMHLSAPSPAAGGVQWLVDKSLFRAPADHIGNVGRGVVPGPGSWNYDFAVLRAVPLSEGGMKLQFRAEFYDLFNHANLSPPVSLFTQPDFGRAYYGLNRTFSRFGDLPLENPSRRIQFGLRLEF